jgi:phosphoglycerol transferase
VVIVLHLWDADRHVPLTYFGDSLFDQSLIKGVIEHGWFQVNPNLGAPFSARFYDFPESPDLVYWLLVKWWGLFTSNPAVVMNVIYVTGFSLIAAVAYWVLRALDLSRPTSVAFAVIFALAPYHFAHGEFQAELALYVAIPAGGFLILQLLAGRPLFTRRPVTGRAARARSLLTPRNLAVVALCALVGSNGSYYTAFVVAVLAGSAIIATVSRGSLRPLLSGGALVGLIALVYLANLSPTLRFWAEHGRNPVTGHRDPSESESQGLKPITLILPTDEHRIGALKRLTDGYETRTALGQETGPELGLVGTVGLLGLLGLAFALVLGPRSRMRRAPPLVKAAATAVLVSLAFGVVGGGSAIIAFGITPDFRSWSRISILIAFFCLVAVAIAVDGLRGWLRRRRFRYPTPAFIAVLAGIMAFAVWDQTSPADVANFAALSAQYNLDGEFVGQVEGRFGPGASVLQLPSMRDPEPVPRYHVAEYEPLRGYLHSQKLRWSYGALKGRPDDWTVGLDSLPDRALAPAAAAAGFDALWLDHFGYPDAGAALEAMLQRDLGPPVLVRRDNRLAVYDVRGYRARLLAQVGATALANARAATLSPITLEPGAGFAPPADEKTPNEPRIAGGQQTQLVVDNMGPAPRMAVLEAHVRPLSGKAGRVELRGSDGSVAGARVTRDGATLRLHVRLQPGPQIVAVTTDAPTLPPQSDGFAPTLELTDLHITDSRLASIVAAAAEPAAH